MDSDQQGGGHDAPQPSQQPTAMIDYRALALAMKEVGAIPPASPPAPPADGRPSPPPADGPKRVTIDKTEFDAFLALKRQQEEAVEQAKKKEEELALKRGEYETVLKARDKEIADSKARVEAEEKRFRASTRDRELITALAGKNLIPGAAEQLVKLWRDDFDAHPDGDGYRVLSRDYQPVADEVAKRLASATYSHFILPSSRGGGGAPTGGQGTTPTPPSDAKPPAPEYRNLGEAIVGAFNDVRKQRSGKGPMGLRPSR